MEFTDIESGPGGTKKYFIIIKGSKNCYVPFFIRVEHRIKKIKIL